MVASVLVDAGFLVALIERRENHHIWAATLADRMPPPWQTCDAVLSEVFHLTGELGFEAITTLLRTEAVRSAFHASQGMTSVLELMEKYADIPMSFADACLVRMTEILPDPMLLTTDSDFRIYRRLGRKAVPYLMPE